VNLGYSKELVELGQGELIQRESEHSQSLLRESRLGAGAQGVDDVDDETVCRRPHGHWTCAHQEGDNMEEVWEVTRHIQAVVEGEHE